MTVTNSMTQMRRSELAVRGVQTWHRFAILIGLISADVLTFAVADLVLNILGTPPALALFRGRDINQPQTVVDLFFIIAIVFIATRYFVGDYSRRQLFWDGARATTSALCISGVIYVCAACLLTPQNIAISLLTCIGMIFVLPAARQAMRFALSKAGIWLMSTALFGTTELAQEVYPVLSRQLSLGLDVRWIVLRDADQYVPSVFTGLTSIPLDSENLIAKLVGAGCRQAILVPDEQSFINQTDIIDRLVGAGMNVAIVPSLRRLPLFGLDTSYFFGKDLLLLQVRNNLARLPQRILKRSLDFIGSIFLLVALSPLLLTLALLIKLEDGGSPLFLQSRVGRYGRHFRCWKFRTMAVDAEAQMTRWKEENPILLADYRAGNFKLKSDPRVTRIGNWMRQKSVDELPQLVNVLLGQMSLVGPRPLLTRELEDYGPIISLYERVRPGITGLWQVSGRSQTTFAQRVSYDEWYIKNWTVWYDTVILLQTAWVLFHGEGAY